MNPLGRKITPPEAEPVPDEFESFTGSQGTRMKRNKRTGAIETDELPVGPQFPEPVYIYSGAHWDAVIKQMQKQVADGFPLNEFGSM